MQARVKHIRIIGFRVGYRTTQKALSNVHVRLPGRQSAPWPGQYVRRSI
jgi:hypothetical protein